MRGDGSAIEGAADFAAVTGDGDGGLDGNGKARERSRTRTAGLRADPFRIEVDEGVELRVETLDLSDVLVGELERSDGAAAQERELFDGRQEDDRHKRQERFYENESYNLTEVQRPFPWAEILGRGATPDKPIRVARAAGRCVLVTGAGGFIGGEMVRVLAQSGARRLVLVEIAEQALFQIHAEMTARGHGGRCVPVLGSVCDGGFLRAVFEEHRPELVVHAAALKQVPLMERNPLAAVETNALGTWRVALAAEEFDARAMVLISTDKAVAPRSVMGAAKRVAELAMLRPGRLEAGRMRRAAVRLANVIGSPCSVGPLFAEQIARGGPVTVTHREARRFFLTLAEVAVLLAEAIDADAAEGVLIPEPGEAVRIEELARRMIAGTGRPDGAEVPIEFTALRPGEKLDERLAGAEEGVEGWATAGLRRVKSPAAENLAARTAELEAAIRERDLNAALRILGELVPDYEASAVVRESVAEMGASRV